jgi:predicted RNase H-like HicB family nuclease
MNSFPYRIIGHWSLTDDSYVTSVPAIPGASGDGQTLDEAAQSVRESALRIIQIMREHGDSIPPPDAYSIDKSDYMI